jgi:hypothetical protein
LLTFRQVWAMPAAHCHRSRIILDFPVQWHQSHPGDWVAKGNVWGFTERSGLQYQRLWLARQMKHHANMAPGTARKNPNHITGKAPAGKKQQIPRTEGKRKIQRWCHYRRSRFSGYREREIKQIK